MSFKINHAIFGVLVAGVTVAGLGRLSAAVFAPQILEKPAYVIALQAGASGGTQTAAATLTPEQFAALVDKAAAADGEKVAKKCAACHQFQAGGANAVGPALHDVFGRPIATAPGYAYSEALKGKAGGNWDVNNLNAWLAGPQSFAKGTKMMLAISKDEDRAALIAYLKTLKK